MGTPNAFISTPDELSEDLRAAAPAAAGSARSRSLICSNTISRSALSAVAPCTDVLHGIGVPARTAAPLTSSLGAWLTKPASRTSIMLASFRFLPTSSSATSATLAPVSTRVSRTCSIMNFTIVVVAFTVI